MRKQLMGIALSLASIVLCGAPAWAGVIITSTELHLDTKQTNPATIFVEADRLKVMTPDNTMIFRGDQNKVWVIRGQTYMEFTEEMVRGMGAQMAGAASQANAAQGQYAGAQAQLQARLAQLPPEQRAMVEAQMARNGGFPGAGGPSGGGGQLSYTPAGPGRTVASWRCQMFSKSINGQKEEDVCIAPLASAGLTQADFQVLQSFSVFMAPVLTSPMAPHNDYMSWNDMNKATGFQGFPVDTIVYLRGMPFIQTTVQKVEHAPIPAAAFDLPAGVTKQNGPPR